MGIATGLTTVLLTAVTLQARPPCPPGEGAPVQGPWGVTLCEQPARVPVVMYDEPQPGVRAVAVAADGLLGRAGLAADDVIYQVAGVRVTTAKEVLEAIGDPSTASGLTVSFWRDRKPYLVRVWVTQR